VYLFEFRAGVDYHVIQRDDQVGLSVASTITAPAKPSRQPGRPASLHSLSTHASALVHRRYQAALLLRCAADAASTSLEPKTSRQCDRIQSRTLDIRLRFHVCSLEDVSFAGHGVAQEECGLHVCSWAVDSENVAVDPSVWTHGFGTYGCCDFGRHCVEDLGDESSSVCPDPFANFEITLTSSAWDFGPIEWKLLT
jgi:hypothetical protein